MHIRKRCGSNYKYINVRAQYHTSVCHPLPHPRPPKRHSHMKPLSPLSPLAHPVQLVRFFRRSSHTPERLKTKAPRAMVAALPSFCLSCITKTWFGSSLASSPVLMSGTVLLPPTEVLENTSGAMLMGFDKDVEGRSRFASPWRLLNGTGSRGSRGDLLGITTGRQKRVKSWINYNATDKEWKTSSFSFLSRSFSFRVGVRVLSIV